MSIDRRENLSLAEFRSKYVARSQPVILTDAIDHWPASRKWNLDFFETEYGDKTVRFDKKEWTIREVIHALKNADGAANTPYLKEVKLDEQFPELWADVPGLTVAQGNRLKSKLLPKAMRIDRGIVALFIGSKGSGFRKLHWDYSHLHVYISQVYGDKDFIVFEPDQTKYLYPNPEQPNLSLVVDPYNFDRNKFPDFDLAKSTTFTVKQGETLFLPDGWWHATVINGPSIAIAESSLDAFNWEQRKNWYLDMYERMKVPRLKRTLLSAYLGLIDKVI